MLSFKSKPFIISLGLGIFSYLAYWITQGLPIVFVLIGPPIFIAVTLRNLLGDTLSFLPWNSTLLVVFPITVLYYGAIGFHLGNLQTEHKFLRLVSYILLAGFLLYIHYLSWTNLIQFYLPHIYG